MSIRVKLTLLLTLCMAFNTAAAGLLFTQLQRRSLSSAESARVTQLIDNIATMAEEAQMARDVLMLVEYLRLLRHSYPELEHWRLQQNGRWLDEGRAAPDPRCCTVVRRSAERMTVEVWLRKDVLARRVNQAREAATGQILRLSLAVLALGLLISLVLGTSLTRRLRQVERATEEIASGRWGAEIPVRGRDEIAHLMRMFNAMSLKLRELDQIKKTFVASVTHELRSPLGMIQSQVREALTGQTPLDETMRGALDRIGHNAARLEHFVGNLLQMAKIERGKLDYQPRRVALGSVVEETVLFHRPRASELGLELRLELGPDLPALSMDPDLISQVLGNLISNAFKFTPAPGSVTVSAQRRDDQAFCSVADTGVGIAAGDLRRLFQPFERIANPLRATGAGLGLAISKSIIDMHGGTIGAESSQGAGSRFFFALPLRPS